MRPVKTFHVRPALPERLGPLEDLAYNLRWSWDPETIGLFRRLDRDLWRRPATNPVLMLEERLAAAPGRGRRRRGVPRPPGPGQRGPARLHERPRTWHARKFGPCETPAVAYFSMEFGITECLPIYSATRHPRRRSPQSASELGIPLVGVGVLYQKGYFRQYLTADGWQQERYPVNDFSVMPVRPFREPTASRCGITVEIGNRPLVLRPWRAQVGRVTLVLLDANIPENPPELQDTTDELYGGDLETRIRQEIVLGVGGVRMLEALGMRPRLFHMNEGHSAFLGLERIRTLMKTHGLTFAEAFEVVGASGVFTTHTPVPAGIDVFPPDLVERYLSPLRHELGVSREVFLNLGRITPGQPADPFNAAVLAMRTAGFVNGVSRLHAAVSRRMWREAWRGIPVDELPISHVTNGVHPQSWISEDIRALYDRYLGPRWEEEPGDTEVWTRGEHIPGEELWRTHRSAAASGWWRSRAGGSRRSSPSVAPARPRSPRSRTRSIPRR